MEDLRLKIILGFLQHFEEFRKIVDSWQLKILAVEKILARILCSDVAMEIRKIYEDDLFDGLFGVGEITNSPVPFRPFLCSDERPDGICIGLYQTGGDPHILVNDTFYERLQFRNGIHYFDYPFDYQEICYMLFEYHDCKMIKIIRPLDNDYIPKTRKRDGGLLMNSLIFSRGHIYDDHSYTMEERKAFSLALVETGSDKIPSS